MKDMPNLVVLFLLEITGGFASVRNRLYASDLNDKKQVVLYLKGDGKNYQFRLKHKKERLP